MNIQWAVLAENAVRREGTIDILGVILSVHFEAMPAELTDVRLALRVTASSSERGTSANVELWLVHSDGKGIQLGAGSLSVPEEPALAPADDVHVIPIKRMTFSEFGGYQLRLLVDGRLAAAIPLQILPLT